MLALSGERAALLPLALLLAPSNFVCCKVDLCEVFIEFWYTIEAVLYFIAEGDYRTANPTMMWRQPRMVGDQRHIGTFLVVEHLKLG